MHNAGYVPWNIHRCGACREVWVVDSYIIDIELVDMVSNLCIEHSPIRIIHMSHNESDSTMQRKKMAIKQSVLAANKSENAKRKCTC